MDIIKYCLQKLRLTGPSPQSRRTQDTWWIGSYNLLGGTGYSSCLPPSYTPTSFYYSPGYCPNGYSSACTSLRVVGAEDAFTIRAQAN